MRQQRELLHQSEEGETLSSYSVSRETSPVTAPWGGGDPSLNVLRAVWEVNMAFVFHIEVATPFRSIRREPRNFPRGFMLDFHRRPRM